MFPLTRAAPTRGPMYSNQRNPIIPETPKLAAGVIGSRPNQHCNADDEALAGDAER